MMVCPRKIVGENIAWNTRSISSKWTIKRNKNQYWSVVLFLMNCSFFFKKVRIVYGTWVGESK
jgi:hypothetical protein